MGKLFCIIGKSGSGKDTVFARILQKNKSLIPVVTYTTRPIRTNETDGKEYHFVDEPTMNSLESAGKVIERRTYHTVCGDWHYFTCTIDLSDNQHHIMIGTADVADKLYQYYPSDDVVIIYLDLPDKERLLRCIDRESTQKTPNYSELCRRFLADEKDFDISRISSYPNLHKISALGSRDEVLDECLKIIEKY